MPTALETLIKILKLERDNGFKNNAVIGGLSKYRDNWQVEAREQARRPEHHILVDELVDLMQEYDSLEDTIVRHERINYMLDRIMGRVDAPGVYQGRLDQYQQDEQQPEDGTSATEERPKETTQQSSKDENKQKKPPELAARKDRSRDRDAKADKHEQRDKRERRDKEDRRSHGSSRQRTDLKPQPRLARPPRKPRELLDPQAALDTMQGLNNDVSKIQGVGPRMATSLGKLGIYTINDLLFFLPRRYDDYTQLAYISKLQPNKVATVIGTVRYTEVRVGQSGRKDFYMELDDGSGVLNVIFFGQHFLLRSIRKGKQIVLSGKVGIFGNRLQMSNPEWEELDAENLHTTGIVPVYPLTEGLSVRRLRNTIHKAVNYWADMIPDYVPEATLERVDLADLGWAIKNLHFPEGMDHLNHARRRFIFDQLLLLQLAVLANRRDWQAVPAQPIQVREDFVGWFTDAAFPYELTAAQAQALVDIQADMSKAVPMNRLLQGDVGSGKTAVAATALAMTYADGRQGAIMAPTSILAEQHYRSLTETYARAGDDLFRPVVALLTGALTQSERDSVYRGLADGSIDIVIGTHALIQEGVEFLNLGLAIIDEQHRFGVGQRGTLRGKGTNPHLLVMTATPIPRTLALTMYADLDLTVMDEMPPGRTPIQTRLITSTERERIYGFIEAEIEKGRQAFIVYPLVEASDKVDALSATEAYDHISQVFFRHRVGLLHGRMKPTEKDEIMSAFARHEFDILVTTAVVEVGVDIPNASVILIEGANRFGLAQLHQFRGRVGRGEHPSYCLLVPDKESPESTQRLQAMEETTDGFKLAEIDWEMRGAGDLVGLRQSGRTALQLMEFMSPELVELAQREARTIYEEDPYLDQEQHHLIARRVEMLYHDETDVS